MKINKLIKEIFKTLKPNKYMKFTVLPLFLFSVVLFTYYIVFTFGKRDAFDLSIALIMTVGGILLLAFIASHIFDSLKQLPSSIMFYGGTSIAMLVLVFNSSRTPMTNIVVVIAISLLFVAFGNMVYGLLFRKNQKMFMKVGSHLLLIISICAVVGIFLWPGQPGELAENAFLTYKTDLIINESSEIYDVSSGVYGSDDYLSKFQDLTGETSDTTSISYFLNKWSNSRENHLGFNVYGVPLNAHYYLPKGEGPFPLLVLVHGNHEMTHDSEIGYGYIGNYLASRGYVVVSVDENFLNYSRFDSKLMGSSLGNENDARGYVLLKHVELLLEKTSQETSSFYNMINEDQIALMGHSRGGEAVSVAAFFNQINYLPNNYNKKFNESFKIKSVIAVAPTDRQYKPAGKNIELEDINYLLLHGAQDMDVTYMAGINQYERIKFTEGSDYFKSAVYIFGANHGHFNEVWHSGDTSPISGLLHNTAQLIDRNEQEAVASQLIFNFLEATLKEDETYKKGFENLSTFTDLPETLYMSQYHESNDLIIVDYTEDNYLETGTLLGTRLSGLRLNKWYENTTRLDGKVNNVYGAYLGWNSMSESSYDIDIETRSFGINDILYLSIADDTKENETLIDFKIRLEDNNGNQSDVYIHEYGLLQHKIVVNLAKFYFIEDVNNSESVYQTIQLPLELFMQNNDLLDLTKLQKISLVFENGDNNVIILKDLGIRRVD